MRRASLSLVVVAACAILPATANGATAQQAIAALNQQRTGHGIPAAIVENREWSRRCALHVNWMIQNNTLAHEEAPGSPGYTEDGNWAGTHSVLAAGTPGFTKPSRNPYLNAPYHLGQLLDPRLKQMGVAEKQGWDCETTFPGYTRLHPVADHLYSYPGPAKSVAWLQDAREGPSTPGDAVGLPQGTVTGPNLIVFWDGPQKPAPLTDIRSASLRRPDGSRVDVRVVDQRNGGAIGGSGFIIPVKPLRPGKEYTGRVTWGSQFTARTFTKSWTFKTDRLRTGKAAVSIGVKRGANDRLEVTADPHDRAYLGRKAKLIADYGQFDFDVDMRIGQTTAIVPAPAKGKTLKLTLRVASFKAGSTKTKAFRVSRTVKG
ncbi:MAG TPA: hypothetical protein VJT75_07270 [Thermoleophilaceae bacterium]|nr:hypothetical protein [Thermoleophilaceae bacterium]